VSAMRWWKENTTGYSRHATEAKNSFKDSLIFWLPFDGWRGCNIVLVILILIICSMLFIVPRKILF
jgi:hypothetical protein